MYFHIASFLILFILDHDMHNINRTINVQSQKVGDAFYAIDWPAVENNDRKSLLICILNGYKTLYVTAGKVYTFSLSGFTSVSITIFYSFSKYRGSRIGYNMKSKTTSKHLIEWVGASWWNLWGTCINRLTGTVLFTIRAQTGTIE